MKALDLVRKALLYASAAVLCIGRMGSGGAPVPAHGSNQNEEVEMGQEIFNALKANGEIVESSPLYDQLRPIADAISRAAQPQYEHPFEFYLIHEDLPDAFAAPGGNVYVVDSFLYFVRNSDELAGTLCHEVSHTIHHDTVAKIRKQKKITEREARAAELLGADRAKRLGIPRSGSSIPSDIPVAWSHERTWPAPIFALPRDTIPGAWCGSSRISRIPIWKNYHSYCPTIPPFSIALIHSSGISAHIHGFLGSSVLIQNRRGRFRFRKRPRRCSCLEGGKSAVSHLELQVGKGTIKNIQQTKGE